MLLAGALLGPGLPPQHLPGAVARAAQVRVQTAGTGRHAAVPLNWIIRTEWHGISKIWCYRLVWPDGATSIRFTRPTSSNGAGA